MTYDKDDKVALRRGPDWVGRVTEPESAGKVSVAFDKGGGGRFSVDDVMPVKSWPPSGMETKTPAVETK